MKHRTVASAAALVIALCAVPAAAASSTLTVSGPADHAVDWTVAVPTTLDLSAATINTSGRLFGVAVEDVAAHRVRALAWDAPELRVVPENELGTGDPPPVIGTPEPVNLAPGTYRLRLIGESAGDVAVPVTAGDGAALQADTPSAPASVRWEEPSALQPLGITVDDVVDFDFPAGAVGTFTMQEHSDIAYAGNVYSLCVRPASESCATGAPVGGWFPGASSHQEVGHTWWRWDGQLRAGTPAGRYAGEVTWLTAGGRQSMDEIAVVVPPSG